MLRIRTPKAPLFARDHSGTDKHPESNGAPDENYCGPLGKLCPGHEEPLERAFWVGGWCRTPGSPDRKERVNCYDLCVRMKFGSIITNSLGWTY